MARKVYENVMAQATRNFVDLQKNKEVENSKEIEKNTNSPVVEEPAHETVVEPSVAEIVPTIKENNISIIDDMAFAMPRSGRPKTLEGKYHIYTARLREDLFEYAQSCTGKDKEFQSVNDYINRLIARDMLSK